MTIGTLMSRDLCYHGYETVSRRISGFITNISRDKSSRSMKGCYPVFTRYIENTENYTCGARSEPLTNKSSTLSKKLLVQTTAQLIFACS